jgi:hypothetical protein
MGLPDTRAPPGLRPGGSDRQETTLIEALEKTLNSPRQPPLAPLTCQ